MSTATQVPNAPDDSHSLPGPGGLLRSAREAAGVSLRDVSAQLHLDERTVDSLERDDFENLPAPTFVRGYLRGYARLLSVPVGPVMEAYDREGFRPPDLVADIAEAPESNATDFPVSLVTWAVVIVLAAMVVVWWNNTNQDFSALSEPASIDKFGFPAPDGGGTSDDRGTTGDSGPASDVASDAASDAASVPASASAGEPANDPASDTKPSATAGAAEPAPFGAVGGESSTPANPLSAPAADSTTANSAATATLAVGEADNTAAATADAANREQPGATLDATRRADEVLADARRALTQSREATAGSAAPGATASAGESPAQPAAAPATGDAATTQTDANSTAPVAGQAQLAIKFANEAWVEVYDRNESKLFYDLAKPGQEVQLSGPTPLRVLLGRTRGVEVRFNGQPFDVTPFIDKGVARFTLPPDR